MAEQAGVLPDPAVPALSPLLGDEASEVLEAALAGNGKVVRWRVAQVRYRPGRSIVVQYELKVTWRSGRTTSETVVASSGERHPENVAVLRSEDTEVSVWLVPNDPYLPGLASATDPDAVEDILRQLGAPAGPVRLRRRAYRPGRRAVIEVNTPTTRLFIKVVRPRRVAQLQKLHTQLAGLLPVPHSYGWSADRGIVAMQAVPGQTMRKILEAGRRRVPEAASLVALLDALPERLERPVQGPVARVGDHYDLLSRVVPDEVSRLDRIVDAVGHVEVGPTTAVHGDFHSSQVLVRNGAVAGLIDVDTAGMGERCDDLAVMLAHLAVLGLRPKVRRTTERYGAELISSFDGLVDPRDLRLRTAAAVVGYATGPFRVQEPSWANETRRRLELAERWLSFAQDGQS